MKRLVIASLFASACIGAQAQTFTDHARVRSVEPQVENISVPRNECIPQTWSAGNSIPARAACLDSREAIDEPHPNASNG